MDNSDFQKRKSKILFSLSYCDNDMIRLNLLAERYLHLEDSFLELQDAYMQSILFLRKLCVQVPF